MIHTSDGFCEWVSSRRIWECLYNGEQMLLTTHKDFQKLPSLVMLLHLSANLELEDNPYALNVCNSYALIGDHIVWSGVNPVQTMQKWSSHCLCDTNSFCKTQVAHHYWPSLYRLGITWPARLSLAAVKSSTQNANPKKHRWRSLEPRGHWSRADPQSMAFTSILSFWEFTKIAPVISSTHSLGHMSYVVIKH